MVIFRHLTSFSEKENPNDQLESYEAATQVERWNKSKRFLCVALKLHKHVKEWYSTFSASERLTTWFEFIIMFLEKFGDDDLQVSFVTCYKIE